MLSSSCPQTRDAVQSGSSRLAWDGERTGGRAGKFDGEVGGCGEGRRRAPEKGCRGLHGEIVLSISLGGKISWFLAGPQPRTAGGLAHLPPSWVQALHPIGQSRVSLGAGLGFQASFLAAPRFTLCTKAKPRYQFSPSHQTCIAAQPVVPSNAGCAMSCLALPQSCRVLTCLTQTQTRLMPAALAKIRMVGVQLAPVEAETTGTGRSCRCGWDRGVEGRICKDKKQTSGWLLQFHTHHKICSPRAGQWATCLCRRCLFR